MTDGGTALLLMGGGARGAYSVGFLKSLARRLPEDYEFTVLSGVSAGAINIAYLASGEGSFLERTRSLGEVWEALEPGRVMDVGHLKVLQSVLLWGMSLFAGRFRPRLPQPRGLVGCRPLRSLLEKALEDEHGAISGIDRRLQSSRLRSVLLSTCSYTKGEWVVWSEGDSLPDDWTRPGRRADATDLTVDHVLASSALPLLFPAVRLDGEWHGDGEIRSSSPLSPCVALGVDRILVVDTYHGEEPSSHGEPHADYPPPGQVAGAVMNSAFLHDLASDARRLQRVNELLEDRGETVVESGKRFRKIGLFMVRPSCDLEQLAGEHETRLPWSLRHMVRGLGTHGTPSPGLLSLLSFQPEYLQAVMEFGEKDAEERGDEIEAFLRESPATG